MPDSPSREAAIELIANEIRSAAVDGRTVEDPRVAAAELLDSGVVVLTASDRSEIERLRARDAEVNRLDPTILGYAQHIADLSAALPGYWRARASVFGWFGIIDEEGWERGMLGLTSEWRVRWEVEIDQSRLSGEADTFVDALIEAMDALGIAAEPAASTPGATQ